MQRRCCLDTTCFCLSTPVLLLRPWLLACARHVCIMHPFECELRTRAQARARARAWLRLRARVWLRLRARAWLRLRARAWLKLRARANAWVRDESRVVVRVENGANLLLPWNARRRAMAGQSASGPIPQATRRVSERTAAKLVRCFFSFMFSFISRSRTVHLSSLLFFHLEPCAQHSSAHLRHSRLSRAAFRFPCANNHENNNNDNNDDDDDDDNNNNKPTTTTKPN